MAIGDVYQVVDTQELAGQKCLNVYFFKMTAETLGTGNAAGVVDGFIANMLPLITVTQVSEVTHTSVKATNLFDAADAHEELISEPGLQTGGYNTTFDAYGFRLVGDNATVRGGR
jgi:hypothetical protein